MRKQRSRRELTYSDMEVWGTPILGTVEDVVSLARTEIRAKGIDLLKDFKPMHNNIMMTCIAHADGAERKPSLGVSTVKVERSGKVIPEGTANCFTCGYTATLPEFLSALFGYNDKGMYGYKWLTQNFVNLSVEKRQPIAVNLSRELTADELFEEQTFISEEELAQYRFTHPYMYDRKLTDKVISYFDIGLDSSTYSVVFPVHDLDGRVPLLQKRSIEGKNFYNDDSSRRGDYVYGLYQVHKNLTWINELYICESPIDALTLWTYRIPAVALFSARITERQTELLRRTPIRKFISALDNDEAGESGSKLMKRKLGDMKLMYRLSFPENVKDVNDMTAEQISNRQITLL